MLRHIIALSILLMGPARCGGTRVGLRGSSVYVRLLSEWTELALRIRAIQNH